MKNPQGMDKKISVMQEGMLKMHEQMHKIMDAKNPQEREQLMQAHQEMMHQHMQAMKDGGMMGGDAKSDSGMGAGKEQKNGKKHT
ncbi:hypothetical protein [Sulfuriferula sp.]|uniref:hypothetical protein n=1 Tax=Sulfuriferula sp. TaxID=2025307 RepID=UPI00273041E2|nr:hypothetical protein [Sulfuriferula sp.]MDP2027982.1 hypothetical protein [Sulfuriferula sp.]